MLIEMLASILHGAEQDAADVGSTHLEEITADKMYESWARSCVRSEVCRYHMMRARSSCHFAKSQHLFVERYGIQDRDSC